MITPLVVLNWHKIGNAQKPYKFCVIKFEVLSLVVIVIHFCIR
jgi:hypothetical protein